MTIEDKKIGSLFLTAAFLLFVTSCAKDAAAPTLSTVNDNTLAEDTQRNDVTIDNGPKGETVNVGVISWRDLPFQTVKRQESDFSCGSAAVATLMTYTYGMKTSEQDVFNEMFEKGDKNKIRHEGFSMLDMANYLNHHGLEARGYKLSPDAAASYKVPFIALINNKGYNHFVVVKAMKGGRILIGDPAGGSTTYSPQEFTQLWNGIALVVTNKASKAHLAFNDEKEWRFARARALLRDGNDEALQPASLSPVAWQIMPIVTDILPATLTGLPSTGGTP